MATRSQWGMTPQQSIEAECRRRGRDEVVAGCIMLLGGGGLDADGVDPQLVVALGGPPARWAVTGEEGGPDYWLRVWAARGLLWTWDDSATEAVVAALSDPAWRVREMAAKVAARHRLGEALEAVQSLADDEVARGRTAAERAATMIIADGA